MEVSGVLGLSGTPAVQNLGLEFQIPDPEKVKSGLNRLKMAPFGAKLGAN